MTDTDSDRRVLSPALGPTEVTTASADAFAAELRKSYATLLSTRNNNSAELKSSMGRLRKLVLLDGLPPETEEELEPDFFLAGRCTLRGLVWKVLLGVNRMSADYYMEMVNRGPSEVYDKIRNDSFRTMATDKNFLARVNEPKLIRLLNAFAQAHKDLNNPDLRFSYVQGMNVLAAPFLYVMPELDAFHAFSHFLVRVCPLYVQPSLEGVHFGVKLLDKCLQALDGELFHHLKANKLSAQVYAFPSVLTFSACTPPLEEVLQLWDFLLAYGVHLNILCIIAQLTLMREELLCSSSPMKLLRTLPDLKAETIIAITNQLVTRLNKDLYDQLVRHPYDPTIYVSQVADDNEF